MVAVVLLPLRDAVTSWRHKSPASRYRATLAPFAPPERHPRRPRHPSVPIRQPPSSKDIPAQHVGRFRVDSPTRPHETHPTLRPREKLSLQELYLQYLPIIRPVLRIGPIFGGVAMLAWRVRETRVPVSAKAIIIPPIAMSSGFLMFIAPLTRVPWSWAVAALMLGYFLLSWPLTSSSRLELRDGVVYMRRSRAFIGILLALLAVRLALHDYIGHLISPLQTASVFFLLAFGMIARWRIEMYRQYRAIV